MSETKVTPPQRVTGEEFRRALASLNDGKPIKPVKNPLQVILQADKQVRADDPEEFPNGLASIPEVAGVLKELRFSPSVEKALKNPKEKTDSTLTSEEIESLRAIFGYQNRLISRRSP